MIWNGRLSRPRLHRGFGNLLGVINTRARQIRPYAAADGTPAAEMRDVKATLDGRIVHVTIAATPQTTMMALYGCPLGDTRETQPDMGRTPSRATAKTRRDAATMAMVVFCIYLSMPQCTYSEAQMRLLTNQYAIMFITFIKICACFPRTAAYSGTKGCGDPKENSVSGSGCIPYISRRFFTIFYGEYWR